MSILQWVARHVCYRSERKSFALNELDKKLAQYVNMRGGFFVEAGANDGVRQSNTLYFEKYLGWQGLLVEPIPDLAEKCRRNRPGCVVEQCALVSNSYPYDTIEMRYCDLMSVVRGAMKSRQKEDAHLLAGQQFLREGEQVRAVTVPARTLSDILDTHGISHVDLLSLDVEGYEPQVLKGLDLDRHSPKFMLIEARCQKEIESIIDDHYRPVAALSINESYSDMLYRRR